MYISIYIYIYYTKRKIPTAYSYATYYKIINQSYFFFYTSDGPQRVSFVQSLYVIKFGPAFSFAQINKWKLKPTQDELDIFLSTPSFSPIEKPEEWVQIDPLLHNQYYALLRSINFSFMTNFKHVNQYYDFVSFSLFQSSIDGFVSFFLFRPYLYEDVFSF